VEGIGVGATATANQPTHNRTPSPPQTKQVKGSDAVVASSPAGHPAIFDLSQGPPLGLKGVGVAVKTMKAGEKAHLVLKPECEWIGGEVEGWGGLVD
jgi:hypothetical protein